MTPHPSCWHSPGGTFPVAAAEGCEPGLLLIQWHLLFFFPPPPIVPFNGLRSCWREENAAGKFGEKFPLCSGWVRLPWGCHCLCPTGGGLAVSSGAVALSGWANPLCFPVPPPVLLSLSPRWWQRWHFQPWHWVISSWPLGGSAALERLPKERNLPLGVSQAGIG